MSLTRSMTLPLKKPSRALPNAQASAKGQCGDIVFVNFGGKRESLPRSLSSDKVFPESVVLANLFPESEEAARPVRSEISTCNVDENALAASQSSSSSSSSSSCSYYSAVQNSLDGICAHRVCVGGDLGNGLDFYAKTAGLLVIHNPGKVGCQKELVTVLGQDVPCKREEALTGSIVDGESDGGLENPHPAADVCVAATPDRAIQVCAALAEGFTMPQADQALMHLYNYWEQANAIDIQWNTTENGPKLICSICVEHCLASEIMECPECESTCCFNCMSTYLDLRILSGDVFVACPGSKCRRGLSEQMIAAFSPNQVLIFRKNKVEMEKNPFQKTCPSCHKVTTVDSKKEAKIHCTNCKMYWCFSCHSHWHSGLTCKEFQLDTGGHGRKALKFWAKSKGKDQANAQRCPKCKFFIERISGCDHMTCSRCKTQFCYKCGGRHRSAGYLGNHYSRLSFLGCKYNLYPQNAPLRLAIRSGVAVGVVVGAPVVGALLIGVGAVVLSLCPILIPAMVAHKVCIK